jgi:hypothetical protein
MIKTQIQLPDGLYQEAKRVAREREISLAEVMRRGLEYIVRVHPPIEREAGAWTPPKPHALGRFRVPEEDWRILANDPCDRADP